MRKITIALAIAVAASVLLLTPGIALANFGIHGGYEMETDACAGCHRAHTAASSITWTDSAGDSQSALLISTADEAFEFCFTCHGSDASGAATNVDDGFYESDEYGTPGADLNGGGFGHTSGGFSSTHTFNGSSWGAWGGGATGLDGVIQLGYGTWQYDLDDVNYVPQIVMSCSSCHDVHGSANYRLLKDVVNGVRVGGYDDSGDPQNPDPTPFVISNEPGYPTDGWRLHDLGAAQIAGYTPNYTEPMYAKAPGGDVAKGISGWCIACHTQYMVNDGSTSITTPATLPPVQGGEYFTGVVDPDGAYDANDGFGFVTRHRHPVNTELDTFLGPRALIEPTLPVATASTDTTWTDAWVDCLTCHVSHGTKTTMSGFANVADSTDPVADSGSGGVDPANSSALLRLNDRGVCQDCHNK